MNEHLGHATALVETTSGSFPSIAAGLLLLGLLTGFTHCTGMCGPFVLTRTLESGARRPLATTLGPLTRISLGALPAYHLGRAFTYSMLGALAGEIGSRSAAVFDSKAVRYAAIGLAATIVLAPAVRSLFRSWRRPSDESKGPDFASRWSPSMAIAGAVAPATQAFSSRTGVVRDVSLGVAMGFLPCGMIYAAVTAAAGTGSPVAGAFGMAAFAVGTWPGLALVGGLGLAAGRRWRARLKNWSVPLAAASLLTMGVWAGHLGGAAR